MFYNCGRCGIFHNTPCFVITYNSIGLMTVAQFTVWCKNVRYPIGQTWMKYIDGEHMATQSSFKERTKDRIKEPRLYKVIMHNDDFTTMEFVVEILIGIFHKDQLTAEALMLDVHKKGFAVIGRFPYDIAVSKTNKAMALAREKGYPFKMTVEED